MPVEKSEDLIGNSTRNPSTCNVVPQLTILTPSLLYMWKIFFKFPIYLQSVIIHSANGGKGEGCLVDEYSVALLY
jgi:hypothetical protein